MSILDKTLIPGMFLLFLLLVIAFIDLKHRIIPNKILFVGAIVGTALNLAVGKASLPEMILGMVTAGVVLLIVALASKGGIGGGDVKLSAMLGIYLGWQHALQTLFLAAVIAALVGLGLILTGRANHNTAIPFGPFLAVSALVHFPWSTLV